MKQTQMDIIKAELKRSGKISRNWCLQRFITRLGARIIDLKNEGWKFKAGFTENNDYLYVVIK